MGGGGAVDVKEPLPLYLKQRALLEWTVQGDAAAVVVMIVMEEKLSERRG